MSTQSEETQFALLNQKIDYLTERVERLEKIIYGMISILGISFFGAVIKLVFIP